ncbi:MAG: hypothetical protein IKB75_07850 [Clostridia bacterium]|nr:hypothetical protein [Clostridia bacterium]
MTRARRLAVHLRYLAVFAMLGALMLCSKLIMEALPNIHPLGMLTMVYTLAFRKKALIPIYLYVFLNGLIAGFSVWWIPYLYIWTILWGVTMLLPRNMPKKVAAIVYPAVCALHGMLFGILYAPAEALFFGLNFEETVAWIIGGIGFDALHTVGNLAAGCFVLPLSILLRKLATRIEQG